MAFRIEGRICSEAYVRCAEGSGSVTMMMPVQAWSGTDGEWAAVERRMVAMATSRIAAIF